MNEKKLPKISVVMPVYNGSDYFEEALESAVGQTYENVEVIVVNDGSTDNNRTEEIALKYSKFITYFKKNNGGFANALNFGVQKSSGSYICYLGHDDKLKSSMFSDYIKSLGGNYCDKTILYGDTDFIDSNSKITGKQLFQPIENSKMLQALMTSWPIHGSTLLIPKRAFLDAGYFDEKLIICDYDLWFRFLHAGFTYRHVPVIAVSSRIHANQASYTKAHRVYLESESLYERELRNWSDRPAPFDLYVVSRKLLNPKGLIDSALYAYNLAKKSQNISLFNSLSFYFFYLLNYPRMVLRNIRSLIYRNKKRLMFLNFRANQPSRNN